MPRITNEQNAEIEVFSEMALALIEDDSTRIISSGFLSEEDLTDDEDYGETLSQKLLESTHHWTLTAHEVDTKLNLKADDMDSVATYQNMEKTYVHIDIAEGDHVNCKLVISNDNEYYIFMTDKDNKVIKCEDGNYEDDQELTFLANHICGRDYDGSYKSFKNEIVEERSIEEYVHYLLTVEDEHFTSDESLAEFKSQLINGAINEAAGNEYKLDYIMENIVDGKGALSYLIINDENSIIAERNGDITLIDSEEYRIETIDNGDKFKFKGITATAEPRALHNIEWELTTCGYSIDSVHREAEVDPEPEVKKTRTMKPGR
ncbi:hypothetical protein GR140_19080 [Pseudomonas putida]|uniref:hypothetical protein n=1 Tax=Pseudomonas putida TaxID=303 RepID=UPI001BAF9EE5|nr:hypothetical protein [Pseudomonas putida]QUG90770.1 hypothetical protein GR140_19080 [Pseudomonas putida]